MTAPANDPKAAALLLRHAQAMTAGDYPAAANVLKEIVALTSPTTDVLSDRWIKLSEQPDLLIEKPPAQRWLLDRYVGGRDVGVLPRGRVGLLTGTGGTSKTYLAMQLGVAVATGGFWLDAFRALEPGHVLLALGEEDLDEVRRRLWRVANALELDTDARRAMAERIDVLPLAGVSVALTASPSPGVILATEMADLLRQRLEDRGVDWALVVIDPLSRWAGGGVEGDNEAATRFVQVVETLTGARGNPSVLITHHSSKTSTNNGASDARGVTGIRDGFRWMCSLDALRTDGGLRGVRLRNGKSNYSPEFDDTYLVRQSESGVEGTLRLASDSEAEAFGAANRGAVDTDELKTRLLDTLRRLGTAKNKRVVIEATRGNDAKLYAAFTDLLADGSIARDDANLFVAASGEAAERSAA